MSEEPNIYYELLKVISLADFVRCKYESICGKSLPYAVDDMIDLISSHTGYEIEAIAAQWKSKHIRGLIWRFDNFKATIVVAENKEIDPDWGVTNCDQRFIAVKEAAHIVIDDEEAFVEDYIGLVEDILFDNKITDFGRDGRSDVFYAKIFAMELLFPWVFRQDENEAIRSGKLSSYDVAKKYMIPERELLWILSDNVNSALVSVHKAYDKLMGDFEKRYADSKD